MFEQIFKKDENGVSRKWQDIEESKIKDIYDDCKSKILPLFE
jgi:hypothetical protein